MFNLYQILTGAQGGQALDNLAERFGLSREQADSAVQALIPALSTAFMTKAMHPGGMQEIAGAMADDEHKAAYASPTRRWRRERSRRATTSPPRCSATPG